jgi:5-methylcytosine-specific restriction endonuclease McrA
MPGWTSSRRKDGLPWNWNKIRVDVFRIKGRFCVQVREDTGLPCGAPATDVDHIVPGPDHSIANLRPLCNWHHRHKSSAEGGQARAAMLAKKKPERRSPGLIYDD